jgi:hypothetical protein
VGAGDEIIWVMWMHFPDPAAADAAADTPKRTAYRRSRQFRYMLATSAGCPSEASQQRETTNA